MKTIGMIGGMSCPPVEAAASTAPAKWAGYPMLFMSGIVKVPVVTTLLRNEELIEMMRERALALGRPEAAMDIARRVLQDLEAQG